MATQIIKTANTSMKITLPVGDMMEGLRRGCAAAFLCGRDEKLVRFTVSKSEITIESEYDKHRVIHRLPVVAPIMVEKEGVCIFQGDLLYKSLKTIKPSPKHGLTLEHTIAKKGQPDIDESRQLDEIKWSVYEDGAAISSGAIRPHPACALTELMPTTHEDVPLLELYSSEAKQIIGEMMRLMTVNQDCDYDATVISLRDGSVKFVCIGGTNALERRISPSEYIDAFAGKHDIGMSMEGLKILDGVLSGMCRNDKSVKSVKLRLSGNGVQFIWEVGSTKLYFPVLPVLPSKRLGYIPFGEYTGTPSLSLSFTVEADMLVKRLAHAVCANMRPSEAHAYIVGCLLCFKYSPTAKDNHPGGATMLCRDVEGDSSLSFSIDPKLIHSFARKNEGCKISFEIIPLKNNGNMKDGKNDGSQIEALLRLRSTGNPKVTLTMGSSVSALTNPVP